MKTLLIDNFDSFTYNLYQLLVRVNGSAPDVVLNNVDYATIDFCRYDNIVLSPGPGHPGNAADFGICARVIREATIPILGVCLGHQGICLEFGASVVHAPEPRHGRTSEIFHDQDDLFFHVPSPFLAVRYHSLIAVDLPPCLVETARTSDGLTMAVRHVSKPIWGVQFHPESISSEYGMTLLDNFRVETIKLGRSALEETRIGSEPPRVATNEKVVARTLNLCPDAETVFFEFFSQRSHAVWLDSSDERGRFSFMADGSGPLAEVVSYSVATGITSVDNRAGRYEHECSIFEYLRRELEHRKCDTLAGLPFDFNLGYVGYFGYELKALTGGSAAHAATVPDATWLFVDRAIVFDHLEKKCHLLFLCEGDGATDNVAWADSMERKLEAFLEVRIGSSIDLEHKAVAMANYRHSQSAYLDRIRSSLDAIRNGESYEICLTNMASAPKPADPDALYSVMRRVSPVPYGAYLKSPHVSILSVSPERFLRIDADGGVESKPIKGTRPRGKSPEEDQEIRLELALCEKDRSENLMIVDLVRNDLNRVCAPESVCVPVLFDVETFAPVHQLVSTIRGKLRNDVHAVDCVAAAFPPGSMTGAPKIRTMQIIDELECGPRGIYSGALGWLGLSGAADLSVVIRTIVIDAAQSSFGVGGAIVALSDPDDEYEETMLKSRAMVKSLSVAGQ